MVWLASRIREILGGGEVNNYNRRKGNRDWFRLNEGIQNKGDEEPVQRLARIVSSTH